MTPTHPEVVARLYDESRIAELVYSYGTTLDDKDWLGNAALFTEDGTFLIFGRTVKGRAAIAEQAGAFLSKFARTQHCYTGLVIRLDGDRATVRSSSFAMHIPDLAKPGEHADVGGVFRAECVREGDGWLIAGAEVDLSWSAGSSLAH
jgi:uncharacterized protein (TIGR02246 family)